ncbi:MAG TPA: hypothetical protein VKA06_06850, partial [Spirochaetia bacterium]|nr:hypothetical protein [Spirochaetia bacterium]
AFAPDGSLLVGFDALEGGLRFGEEFLDFDLATVMALFGPDGELVWISSGSPGEEGGGGR